MAAASPAVFTSSVLLLRLDIAFSTASYIPVAYTYTSFIESFPSTTNCAIVLAAESICSLNDFSLSSALSTDVLKESYSCIKDKMLSFFLVAVPSLYVHIPSPDGAFFISVSIALIACLSVNVDASMFDPIRLRLNSAS